MRIIYDLQQPLGALDGGPFSGSDTMFACGPGCDIILEQIEDTCSLLIKNRLSADSGLSLCLSAIDGVQPGDRLSVTGRIPMGSSLGNSWGVALIQHDDKAINLAQHAAPRDIFTLTHILDENETHGTYSVVTLSWGPSTPVIPIYIDAIRITRHSVQQAIEVDPRIVVYSMGADPGILNPSPVNKFPLDSTPFLVRSGNPDISIYNKGGTPELYLSNRVRDFDGVDILLDRMALMPSNRYQLEVTGSVGVSTPKGTVVTFQGVPGYTWCGQQFAHEGGRFSLLHVFTQSELVKWRAVRVTTNGQGATSDFSIDSIIVKRLN